MSLCAHFTAFHEAELNDFRMRAKTVSALQHHSDFILCAPVFSVEMTLDVRAGTVIASLLIVGTYCHTAELKRFSRKLSEILSLCLKLVTLI